jgi:hypothetical protein
MSVRFVIIAAIGFLLISCATRDNADHFTEWDFDHQVQFEQKKFAEGLYQIKVISHSNTHFSRLATFLLRHSYKLCQRYDYQLTIIDGVETVDEKIARPNWISPSLIAHINCGVK